MIKMVLGTRFFRGNLWSTIFADGHCLVVVCWLLVLTAQGQPTTLVNNNKGLLNLTQEEGLPSNEVYDLLQDSRGYIWIATDGGLARYDGVHLKTYVYNADIAGAVDMLQEDHEGRIWCKSYRGQIFYVEADSLRFFEPLNKAPYSFKFHDVFWFHPTKHYLTATLEGRIYTYKGGHWKPWKDGKSTGISRSGCPDPAFYGTNDTILAIGRGPELCVIGDSNQDTIKCLALQSTSEYGRFCHLIPTKNPYCLHLLVQNDNLLLRYQHHKLDTLTHLPNRSAMGLLHKVWVDPQQPVSWLTTSAGLWRWDYTDLDQPKVNQYFAGQNASKFIQDREGNYWIATLNQGVFMVPQLGRVELLGQEKTFLQQSAFLLRPAIDKEYLWIALGDGTIVYYHTRTKTVKLAYQDDLDKKAPIDIDELPDKGVVKVTSSSHQTILRLSDLSPLRKNIKGRLHSRSVPYQGDTILTFGSGLGYVTSTSSLIMEMRSIHLYDLYCDVQNPNAFWGAFRDTLMYYPTFGAAPLPILNPTTKVPIVGRAMAQTNDGTLWVGTHQGQLCAVQHNTQVKGIYQPPQLKDNLLICRALETDGFNVWMGTDKGLFCYIPDTQEWVYYGQLDGLASNQIRDLAWVNGYLYAATPNGVLRIDPMYNPINTTAPLIRLDRVQINNRDTNLVNDYHLSHHQNNLTFHLEGIALRSRGQFTYAYRLLPLDSVWRVVPANAPAVNYAALQPATYHFEAVAVNEDGVWSSTPVVIMVDIAVPYWDQWWFRLLVVLAMGLACSATVWWWVRSIRQRDKAVAQAKERMQNLRLSALQSQMNPHFVFNALSSIEFFILNGELKKALLYHDKLARLMRQTFEYSKKQYIPLEDELEFLGLYLELESMRLDGQLDWQLQCSEEVDGECDEILIPPLLLQPLVENSFKHGLLHRPTSHKMLQVDFSFLEKEQREYLWVRITDNGIGWRQAQAQQQSELKEHRSSGLKITRERLELLSSEEGGPPRLQLIDRSDEGAMGTRVEVCIELHYKHQNSIS